MWDGPRVTYPSSPGDYTQLTLAGQMSQTFFSRLDPLEKASRLGLLSSSRGLVTVWIKGAKEKISINSIEYHKDKESLILDSQDNLFPPNSDVLVSFELRGMTYFSQVKFLKNAGDYASLEFKGELFKSERRSSYRLLTYPIYQVWAEFELGESYQGGNVVEMKSRLNQTKLFQNFIQLVEGKNGQEGSFLKIRVQDLSATGMSVHIGELDLKYFPKDQVFKNLEITFTDEKILIPEAKVVYVVDYISSDVNLKKFKIGINFPNLSSQLDDLLSKKINKLLREVDANKDFETFLK